MCNYDWKLCGHDPRGPGTPVGEEERQRIDAVGVAWAGN